MNEILDRAPIRTQTYFQLGATMQCLSMLRTNPDFLALDSASLIAPSIIASLSSTYGAPSYELLNLLHHTSLHPIPELFIEPAPNSPSILLATLSYYEAIIHPWYDTLSLQLAVTESAATFLTSILANNSARLQRPLLPQLFHSLLENHTKNTAPHITGLLSRLTAGLFHFASYSGDPHYPSPFDPDQAPLEYTNWNRDFTIFLLRFLEHLRSEFNAVPPSPDDIATLEQYILVLKRRPIQFNSIIEALTNRTQPDLLPIVKPDFANPLH